MLIFFFQDSSEVIALQDKLSQSNNKLAEFRNQCEKLKKDLKVAHKVLLKHVTAIYILLLSCHLKPVLILRPVLKPCRRVISVGKNLGRPEDVDLGDLVYFSWVKGTVTGLSIWLRAILAARVQALASCRFVR